ncbi:MAG: anthranilate synthase/aminodeoxychorismate synthase-like glutamine amidotransferase [Myxococcota bacterium]|jgi:anthranilate synthase/aminodeoxychorismate synthase-like glutamine amidotransferase
MSDPIRLLMIDNYDSFTFNLVQYFGVLGAEVEVVRNDAIELDEIAAKKPDALVISPGPCTPSDAGVSVAAVRRYSGELPILGVCLGHQSIAVAFGATIVRAGRIMHGKTSPVNHDNENVFKGLPDGFAATRYHSLVADPATIPDVLTVTARSADDGEIMGLVHRTHPTYGIQFHPESILTTSGMDLLANFLRLACP